MAYVEMGMGQGDEDLRGQISNSMNRMGVSPIWKSCKGEKPNNFFFWVCCSDLLLFGRADGGSNTATG